MCDQGIYSFGELREQIKDVIGDTFCFDRCFAR